MNTFGGRYYCHLTNSWVYSDGSGRLPDELLPESYNGKVTGLESLSYLIRKDRYESSLKEVRGNYENSI